MPTISRTQILRGPCQITWGAGSAPLYSKGDVAVTARTQTLGIATSGFGEIDQRAVDIEYKIRFTPSGEWLNHAEMLFAPMALNVGQSIFGATDKTLVIKPFTTPQQVLTFKNVALSRMPTLRLTAAETIFGEVEFTAIRSDTSTWEVVDSIVAASVYAAPSHSTFDVDQHMVQPWGAAWGASPWDSFQTETGWTIIPGMELSEQRVDNAGLIDLCVRALSVTAQATPIDTSLTESVVLAKLGHAGSGRVRGQGLGGLGADLVLSSADGGSTVTLDKAALIDAQLGWGSETKRIGQCTWRATRTFTSGVANPLLTIVLP
jgi:hypothetical protein